MEQALALDEIEQQARRILDLSADPSTLSLPVPACPGWTMERLVSHLSRVYGWAGLIVGERLQARPARELVPPRPEGTSPHAWLSDRLEALLVELGALSGDEPIWNFMNDGPGPSSFWWRRQLHETLIHRVDAEQAASAPIGPIDAAIAVDNLEEWLAFNQIRPASPEDLDLNEGLSVHLHATDIDGAEWTIATETKQVARAHMKGDVALRGDAWTLALWAWGRHTADHDGLETFGDTAAADQWRATLDLD
jgi:uncharacterized protein (TIGR03083 family)